MEMWFSEIHTPNIKLTIRTDRQLFSGESEYQRIDVFDSPELGKFVTLNGDIIFSDADEFVYDEMVTHVPMAVHPNVKKVLIIGGGDGGVAKELSYYPEIEEIEVVEQDEMFMEVCQKFFPDMAQGLKDPRVKIYHEDGLRFLRRRINEYDLIINDSTNPFGYTEGLFTKEFYGSSYKALKKTASWSISTAALSMTRMKRPAAACTARCSAVFPSAGSTRPISPPVRRDTGSLDSRRKSIIRSKISTVRAGANAT